MGKTEWKMTFVFSLVGAVFVVIALLAKTEIAKWIWGILAAAVFIFTIYATIDTVIKNRRKSKDFADMLIGYLEAETKSPGFEENFAKKMEARASRRDVLYNSQKPEDEDYGYCFSNPIMTSTISGSERYLQRLRTLEGQKFSWKRCGSYCVDIEDVQNVMVDMYQLYLRDDEYTEIFICPYGHESNFVPHGLVLVD